MTILIEDSPRKLASWVIQAHSAGLVRGCVVSPFASPWQQHGRGIKPPIRDTAERLLQAGVELWFDPMTHALQMSGVGDFRFYDEYSLWGAGRGDLTTPAARTDHLNRVFDVQNQLGVNHLAPTILLHTGLSNSSQIALDLARAAIESDPSTWLSIAGSPTFWASGGTLDAHVGALAELEPPGWFISVARPANGVPVDADPEEVHGLCRTVRALSGDSAIHVSHGDLAALPAIAAGATSLGSGWDKRQRVCAYSDYAARVPGSTGGGWFQRPTLLGLLGALTESEAQLLNNQAPALVARLGGLPAPGPEEAMQHHLRALGTAAGEMVLEGDPETRSILLLDRYTAAAADWPGVQAITGASLGSADWIGPHQEGLQRYRSTEGW